MRVVSGEAGGRRLVAPEGRDTRPTSDRVREATFNALGSLGAIEGATVVDLFAGSGAMGIEALSRGAAHATFVERDRAARTVIEHNLAETGMAARATVVGADVLTWVAGGGALGGAPRRFDLAICDPPYTYEAWPDLLAALSAGLVVVESDREVDPGPAWEVVRMKRYGTTVVAIVRPTLASAPSTHEVAP